MTGGGRGVFFEDENDHIFALGVIKRERNRKLFFFPDKVTSVVKRLVHALTRLSFSFDIDLNQCSGHWRKGARTNQNAISSAMPFNGPRSFLAFRR